MLQLCNPCSFSFGITPRVKLQQLFNNQLDLNYYIHFLIFVNHLESFFYYKEMFKLSDSRLSIVNIFLVSLVFYDSKLNTFVI